MAARGDKKDYGSTTSHFIKEAETFPVKSEFFSCREVLALTNEVSASFKALTNKGLGSNVNLKIIFVKEDKGCNSLVNGE